MLLFGNYYNQNEEEYITTGIDTIFLVILTQSIANTDGKTLFLKAWS